MGFSAQFPWNENSEFSSDEGEEKVFSWWKNFHKSFFWAKKLHSFSWFTLSLFPRFSLVVRRREEKKIPDECLWVALVQLLYHRHWRRRKEKTRDLRWCYWFLFSLFSSAFVFSLLLLRVRKGDTATEDTRRREEANKRRVKKRISQKSIALNRESSTERCRQQNWLSVPAQLEVKVPTTNLF